jgi:hypothetical protein
MVILGAFFALLAGLATIAVLSVWMTLLLRRLVPNWAGPQAKPDSGAVVVQLGSAFLIAAAGGCATSLFARANPLLHVLALGIAVLALAALSALQMKGSQPVWFQLAQVAVSPLGVLAGGLLQLRLLGTL